MYPLLDTCHHLIGSSTLDALDLNQVLKIEQSMSFELGRYKELFGKRDDEDHLLVCHVIRKHLNTPVIVIVLL